LRTSTACCFATTRSSSSRGLCPIDLRELEYVRFVTDSAEPLQRAFVALEQFHEYLEPEFELGPYDFPRWDQVLGRLTGGRQQSIDNHSRPLLDVRGPSGFAGDAAKLENALIDVCIAGSLELPELDVLTNSVATATVDHALVELAVGREFSDWHVDVAQEIATIRVPNVWSPTGVYHPSIEELRHDPRVSEFRKYLASQDPDGSAVERAEEITAVADSHARKAFLRAFDKPNLYTTVGRAAIGPVGNAVAAPLGTIASSAVRALDWVAKRREANNLGWAAFVVQVQEGGAGAGSPE
jgi:hypothetical protein